MAILTSKGARAPHQLKGRRNVRISRDRRGCGSDDIQQLKDEVNKALTNLTTTRIETATNANNCILSYSDNLGTEKTFVLAKGSENVPKNPSVSQWILKVKRVSARVTQTIVGMYYDNGVEKTVTYQRSAEFTGTSWAWENWEKLITESDLNNALSDCPKKIYRDLSSWTTKSIELPNDRESMYRMIIGVTTFNGVSPINEYIISFGNSIQYSYVNELVKNITDKTFNIEITSSGITITASVSSFYEIRIYKM